MKKHNKKTILKVKETPWVIYQHKIGRTPPGMYQREVMTVEKIAFVLPKNAATLQADMVPVECVFATQELAEKFIANGGERKWCVSTDWDKPAEIFEGLVKYFTVERWGRKEGRCSTKRISDEKIFNNAMQFDTKKEALSEWRKRNREMSKQLIEESKELDRKTELLEKMYYCKDESR